jgi:hypothetical protein
MEIKGIEFLGLEVSFYSKIPNGNVNLGVVRLECEGRTFVLDTIETEWSHEDGGTLLSIKLEAGIDGCTKEECDSNFDITAIDLFSGNVKGTLWIEEDIEDEDGVTVEPDSISLFYRFNDGLTSVIELEVE